MKKRILIFSTAYLPLVGGAEVAVKEITDRFKNQYEFVMITAKIDKNLPAVETVGNVEVHRLGWGSHLDKFYLFFAGLNKAKKLGKFDLVWAVMASYSGLAALRFKKRNKQVPYLLTLQEGDSKVHIYQHTWFIWPYFKQVFKKANKIQAISTYLRDWAKDMGATCPVEVVPNGVDLDVFLHQDHNFDGFKIKQRLGLKASDKVIISASRLVPKNGLEDLIKAMSQLPNNTHLLLAGEGPLKKPLTLLVQNLELKERVHFLGSVEHKDLAKYFWASDIFCRPSLSEGLGVAFLEAMAASLPVVATKVGGIPDFLQDGETGLFCKVKDPKDIAKQINRVLEDDSLAMRLSKNGRELVKERYSWDQVSVEMNKLIQSIV
jgi:glycosyltransferase involved in cell wall biosynthesis